VVISVLLYTPVEGKKREGIHRRPTLKKRTGNTILIGVWSKNQGGRKRIAISALVPEKRGS